MVLAVVLTFQVLNRPWCNLEPDCTVTNEAVVQSEFLRNGGNQADITHRAPLPDFSEKEWQYEAKRLADYAEKTKRRNSPPADFFAWESVSPTSVSMRYGFNDEKARTWILDGRKQVATGRYGTLTWTGLKPDTEYAIAGYPSVRTVKADPPGKLGVIGVMSDIHVASGLDSPIRMNAASVKITETAFGRVKADGAELLLFAGDQLNHCKFEEMAALAQLIAATGIPSLGVAGNHDKRPSANVLSLWEKCFGDPADVSDFKGVQIVRLSTAHGNLDTPENRAAIDAMNPKQPAIVISHYQLVKDAVIAPSDPDSCIHDSENAHRLLDKIASSRSVILVGHKNIASVAKLGNCVQVNLPQPTQYPSGYVLLHVFRNGVRIEYRPAADDYWQNRGRIIYPGHRDAEHRAEIWNQFIPFPLGGDNPQT